MLLSVCPEPKLSPTDRAGPPANSPPAATRPKALSGKPADDLQVEGLQAEPPRRSSSSPQTCREQNPENQMKQPENILKADLPVSTSVLAKAVMETGVQESALLRSPEVRQLVSSTVTRGKAPPSSPPMSRGLGPMRKARSPAGQPQAFHSKTAIGKPAGGRTQHPRPCVPPRRGAARSSEEGGAPRPGPAGLAVPRGKWSTLGRVLSTTGHQGTQ